MNASASGANNGASWGDAYTDLQSALGTSPCTEVWVKSGIYKPTTGTNRNATFQLKSGVALYGGFAGTETARTQRNPTVNVTILSGDIDNNDSQTPILTDLFTVSGNTTNSYHVVTGATGATLDGFTITAGYADGGSSEYEGSGGGMYNRLSSPTLTDITFTGNSTYYYGGGMANFGSSPKMMNITFSDNLGRYGGGMFNRSSSPILEYVTFRGNLAWHTAVGSIWGDGGGMFNYDSSMPTLTNVTFSGNSADYGSGGGMFNQSSNPMLTNVTFSGNSAGSGDGDGMENYSGSSPTIRNTIFWGSTDQIYNSGTADSPVVSYSVVQGGYAGGTYIITTDPMLGSLGDYGGFTQIIPLQAGSSAIDTGNNAVCPATDQRGYMRPVDGDVNGSTICDIGAYEAGAVALPTFTYVYLPLVVR